MLKGKKKNYVGKSREGGGGGGGGGGGEKVGGKNELVSYKLVICGGEVERKLFMMMKKYMAS